MKSAQKAALSLDNWDLAPESGEISCIRQIASEDAAEPGQPSRLRTGTPSAAHGLFSLRDFTVLAERSRNRCAPWIERMSGQIASRAGLLRTDNLARFKAFNSLVAYVYPRASMDAAVACSLWCNWLFFFDDALDEDRGACSDPARVRGQMEHYLSLLEGGSSAGLTGPLEVLTLEFRKRALELSGPAWLARFCANVRDYLFRGVLPAVENYRSSRTPSLAEYVEQRDHDGAVLTALDLIEVAEGIELPGAALSSPDMALARLSCVRTIGFFNDIVSYPKEVIRHKNPNNLVHVLMTEHGISVREALHEALSITNEAARTITRAEASIRSRLPGGPHPIKDYLNAMRAWQRGNIDYSLEGERYASCWSPVTELLRPGARH